MRAGSSRRLPKASERSQTWYNYCNDLSNLRRLLAIVEVTYHEPLPEVRHERLAGIDPCVESNPARYCLGGFNPWLNWTVTSASTPSSAYVAMRTARG